MKGFKKFIHQWAWLLLLAYCIIGLIYPFIGIAALICMLAPVALAFFKGRMWCGNFCPRGSFNDVILSRLSLKNRMPNFLKTAWFRNLFLVVLMSAFAIQLAVAWGNALAVSQVFIRMIIITTALAVVLGVAYNHRAWCMICPMGTMAHYAARTERVKSAIRHVSFNKGKCVGCKMCNKKCPVGIDVLCYKEKERVTNADCLKCGVCVEACPKRALNID
ncbi:4Fe-4S binding protein [Anaerobacterium chartisolvens]|uniref:4Fe-4S binding protein n=1 Tax=Anaerobacterium chartisolvens TaxID=1297424 RepID=A0A369BMP9_9FIRM|nr:4Fe-4S binding protein [Anaerobacterium chartisolvens]RCX20954.1 4Fe-4S binding protein [Anaerobacterium chartisolvens]